jgi:hypothetical protein
MEALGMNKTTVAQQAKPSSLLPPAPGLLQRKCACGNHTFAGGECAECAKNKSGLQRKLTIGASNDPLELEADRVADQVLVKPLLPDASRALPLSLAISRILRRSPNPSSQVTEGKPKVKYKYQMSGYKPSTGIGHFDGVEFNSDTQILTITIRPSFNFDNFNVNNYPAEVRIQAKQEYEKQKEAVIGSFIRQAEGWGGQHVFFCQELGLEQLKASTRVEVDIVKNDEPQSPEKSYTPVSVKDSDIRSHSNEGLNISVAQHEVFTNQYDPHNNKMVPTPVGPPFDLRGTGESGSFSDGLVGRVGIQDTRAAKPKEQLSFTHELGHIFGLDDEYVENKKPEYALGKPTKHSSLAKSMLGKDVVHGGNNDSIMAVGNKILAEHGVTFLEALQKVTNMRWGFEPATGKQSLQRKAINDTNLDSVPSIVNDVLSSPGQPLDSTTRIFMEDRFGYDFSEVRVHTGSAAEQSAQDVNAHAYTVGHNVVFGAGQFAPGTHAGRRLLAHELAHVVQKGNNHHIRRKEVSASLVTANRGNVAPGDWLDLDRQEWEMASQNGAESSLSPTNTFMRAVYFNTQNLRPQEYRTVRERHDYYDVISYVLENDRNTPAALRGVRFFHATTAVTGSPGIGSVDTTIGAAKLQQQTRTILRQVNEELFALNMGIIQNLLFNWHEPRNSKSPTSGAISSFDFDIKMVETEQSSVEDYLRRNRQLFTDSITQEINNTLDPNAFGQFFNPSRTNFEWATKALQIQSLDFTDVDHRKAIGFATVHIFHRKSYSDYKAFMDARKIGDFPGVCRNCG